MKVVVLGREYSLRVQPGQEALTLDIAEYVDSRMRAFRKAHPDQHDVTAAVITALAITEELFQERRKGSDFDDWLGGELETIDARLAEVLADRPESD